MKRNYIKKNGDMHMEYEKKDTRPRRGEPISKTNPHERGVRCAKLGVRTAIV